MDSRDWCHMVFVCLTALSVIISRPVPVAANNLTHSFWLIVHGIASSSPFSFWLTLRLSLAFALKVVLQWILGCVYLFTLEIDLDMCPGGGMLGQTVTLSLVSEEHPFCSAHRQHWFTFPPTVEVGSLFNTLSRIYYLQTFWTWPFWLVWGDTSM